MRKAAHMKRAFSLPALTFCFAMVALAPAWGRETAPADVYLETPDMELEKKQEKKPEKSPRTLEHFKKTLDKTFTPAKAEAVFGKPDAVVGSGLRIFKYNLTDGSIIYLGFPGNDPIQYARHVLKDNSFVILPLK